MSVGIRSRVYESALRRRWSDAWAPLGEDLDAMTTLNLQYDLTFPENRAVMRLANRRVPCPTLPTSWQCTVPHGQGKQRNMRLYKIALNML